MLAIALLGAICGGVLAAASPALGGATAGAAAVLALLPKLRTSTVVALVVASAFTSRLSVTVAGYHVRPEHIATALLVLKVLPGTQRLPAPRRRSVLMLAGIVFLEALSTFANSPSRADSLSILFWLSSDLLLLWALAHVVDAETKHVILRTGMWCATATAVAAVALWAASLGGYSGFGVQTDPAYGGHAAYVLGFEANVTAGWCALWGLIALVNLQDRRLHRVAFLAAVTCPLGIVATHTRAAALGYVVGFVGLAVGGRVIRGRQVAVAAIVAAVMWSSIGAVTHNAGGAATARKFAQLDLQTGDAALRVESWSTAAADMSTQQLFLGLGTNSYGQRHSKVVYPGIVVPSYLGTLPLQIFYDAGAPALLLLLAMLAAVRPRSATGRVTRWALASAYFIISMATSPLWFAMTWVILALGYPAQPQHPALAASEAAPTVRGQSAGQPAHAASASAFVPNIAAAQSQGRG